MADEEVMQEKDRRKACEGTLVSTTENNSPLTTMTFNELDYWYHRTKVANRRSGIRKAQPGFALPHETELIDELKQRDHVG